MPSLTVIRPVKTTRDDFLDSKSKQFNISLSLIDGVPRNITLHTSSSYIVYSSSHT